MEETHVKARRNMDLMKEEQDELDRLAKAGKIFDKSVVKKKYQNKMLEVDDMNFLFQNSNFRVEPPNGSVWPGTMSEITVYYHPLVAGAHQTVAYCEVEGRESRLPLVIKGSATGPRVKFSYTDFNVKQTFINTEYQYEVVLENIGDIDAKFLLLGKSSETEFQFNPNEGVINCGEQLMVRISFTPHAIGHFKKEFIWELEVIFNPNNKGGSENLSLFFEGEVVGPTFEFDVENLKIGKAALGFPTSNIFNFKNTSLIPLSFKLQVLANDLTPSEDFTISPDKGKIPAKGSVPLNLIFCPQTVSLYESKLVVYIDSVGESLNTLSILAESVVPKVSSGILPDADCSKE